MPGDEINSPGGEICMAISPCGKYLFYASRNDIYWVSSAVLEAYRPE